MLVSSQTEIRFGGFNFVTGTSLILTNKTYILQVAHMGNCTIGMFLFMEIRSEAYVELN